MNRISLSIPEIAIIAGTRAALGAGVALLLADRLRDEHRRAVGWTLAAVGVVSTIPILMQVLGSRKEGCVQVTSSPGDWHAVEREYAS